MRKLLPLVLVLFALNVFGKAREEMEVGFTFRGMNLIVEDPGPDAPKIGLTRKDIDTAVKHKLLSRGIQPTDLPLMGGNGSHLWVRVTVSGPALAFNIQFRKWADAYFDFNTKYITATKAIVTIFEISKVGAHAGNKNFILESIQEDLDLFLLDYLESNLKYEQTLKDGKLRGVDLLIQAKHKTIIDFFPKHSPWYQQYLKLPKTAE